MTFSTLSRTALAAALLLLASGASAQFVESGDAPDGVGGTQDASTATTSITGSIVTGDFADCYSIVINDIDLFSVSTEDAGTSIDSQLWLFDTSLEGIVFNDDTPAGEPGGGGGLESSIPAGELSGLGLSPGTYVLCISEWDQDAVNVLDEEIFPQSPFGEVHFPNAPSGDFFLDDWNMSAITPGSYVINLTATGDPGGVTIEYIGSTEDPQRNDYVFIRALATNSSVSTIRTRVYFTVDYPDGATRTYSVLSSDFPGTSSFQVQQIKRMKFPIPADAPAGTYTVTIYAADDIASGGTVYDSDTFTFDLAPIWTKAGDLASGVGAGPNPFTSETTIRYELAEAAEVDLRVFDVTGREVAQLATGTHSAGAHSALFAAGDLPGGVYVWRLAVGGEVTTGRVTLAR